METTTPRILVVGSSGKLAGYIIKEIILSFGIEALTISDYKTERLRDLQKELFEEYGKEPNARQIDFTSLKSIKHGMKGVDHVIVPVSQNEPLIQEVCIESGITCIDLSVSEAFIDRVLDLSTQACEGKSLILMAAGLFPGLSGILAKTLHDESPNEIVDIGLIQAKDGIAGGTGIADMLQLFSQEVELYSSSQTSVKKGFRFSKPFHIDDKFGTRHLRLANFIERKYLLERGNIRSNYWSGFDSESFNKLIAFLRTIGVLNLFNDPKMRLKAGKIISGQKNEAKDEVVGIIGQTGEQRTYSIQLESDYSATASCAVAFVKILDQLEQKQCGVFFPFELFDLDEVLRNIDQVIVD